MVERGKFANKYYLRRKNDNGAYYDIKSIDEYSAEFKVEEQPSKRYFKGRKLKEVIMSAPVVKRAGQEEVEKEMHNRQVFVDFLQGLLNLNPMERWTPQQALRHPFIMGDKHPTSRIPPASSAPSVPGNHRSQYGSIGGNRSDDPARHFPMTRGNSDQLSHKMTAHPMQIAYRRTSGSFGPSASSSLGAVNSASMSSLYQMMSPGERGEIRQNSLEYLNEAAWSRRRISQQNLDSTKPEEKPSDLI